MSEPIMIEEKVARRINGHAWLNRYACAMCGQEKITTASNAKASPDCKTCGFKKRYPEIPRSNDPAYAIWKGMMARCNIASATGYSSYGGRGIKVCDQWSKSSRSFLHWCSENGWRKGLEIDRINVDGVYSPNNCRLVTRSENRLNQRRTKMNGQTASLLRQFHWSGIPCSALAAMFGVSTHHVRAIVRFKSWRNDA